MVDKKLLALLGKDRKYIGWTVGLMVAGLGANLAFTASICKALEMAVRFREYGERGEIFLLPVFVAMAALVLRYWTSRTVGDLKDLLGRNAKRELRRKVYAKVLRLGNRQGGNQAGLTQLALEGVEQLDLYYSNYIPQFFYAMIAPLVLFGVTVWFSLPVAVVLLACVPLIPLSIVAVSRYAKRIFRKYWGKYTAMGDDFLDSVQGLRELKIFTADQARQEEMDRSSQEFRRITMKVLVMQLASTTIMDLVAYGGAGVGIALTLKSVAEGNLSPFSALFLVLVAVEFFLPLRAFGAAFHVAMNGASAGNQILELLNQSEPVWGEETVKEMELELKEVSYSYDGSRQAVKNLSVKFPKTGMVALVGPSGCGKSTIVGLLSGELRPDSGQVTVGKIPLEQLSREELYKHLGLVSYNTYVFNQSVRENFRLAKEDVTDREIFGALKLVNLDRFVRENGGLDRSVAEEGANLSGGQKQRLALGINLVGEKEVYLFDEATSNINPESEKIIMDNILRLARDHLILVISHRLANVVQADEILYMESGQVLERGTHAQLMERQGSYASLYAAQKELEEGYREEENQ